MGMSEQWRPERENLAGEPRKPMEQVICEDGRVRSYPTPTVTIQVTEQQRKKCLRKLEALEQRYSVSEQTLRLTTTEFDTLFAFARAGLEGAEAIA